MNPYKELIVNSITTLDRYYRGSINGFLQSASFEQNLIRNFHDNSLSTQLLLTQYSPHIMSIYGYKNYFYNFIQLKNRIKMELLINGIFTFNGVTYRVNKSHPTYIGYVSRAGSGVSGLVGMSGNFQMPR